MSQRAMEFVDPDKLGFLQRLTLQLTIGAASFPDALRDLHGNYLIGNQKPDGGWGGREGDSDLYYTGFALRSLAILGLLEGSVAEKAASYLQSQLRQSHGWVDLLSLIYGTQLIQASCGIDCMEHLPSDWEQRLSDLLQRLRRKDGGYSKSDEGQAGSTYQTFLVTICMELLGRTIPESERAVDFLLRQRQTDGGFLEVRVGKRSGTNPTAAAIAALSCLGLFESGSLSIGSQGHPSATLVSPEDIEQGATEFLLELQTDEGGFQANTRMPLPDVLSTFTACTTLWELERLDQADLEAAARYVRSMQRPQGGFAGFELDPAEDVEYTFYALGTLAFHAGSGAPFAE